MSEVFEGDIVVHIKTYTIYRIDSISVDIDNFKCYFSLRLKEGRAYKKITLDEFCQEYRRYNETLGFAE
jgi:hypothetical protein